MTIILKIFYYRINDEIILIVRKIVGPLTGILSKGIYYSGMRSLGLKMALWAYRMSYTKATRDLIKNQMQKEKFTQHLTRMVSSPVDLETAAYKSLIIRWPEIEDHKIIAKGILIITFTSTFSFFLKNIRINTLAKYFSILIRIYWPGKNWQKIRYS